MSKSKSTRPSTQDGVISCGLRMWQDEGYNNLPALQRKHFYIRTAKLALTFVEAVSLGCTRIKVKHFLRWMCARKSSAERLIMRWRHQERVDLACFRGQNEILRSRGSIPLSVIGARTTCANRTYPNPGRLGELRRVRVSCFGFESRTGRSLREAGAFLVSFEMWVGQALPRLQRQCFCSSSMPLPLLQLASSLSPCGHGGHTAERLSPLALVFLSCDVFEAEPSRPVPSLKTPAATVNNPSCPFFHVWSAVHPALLFCGVLISAPLTCSRRRLLLCLPLRPGNNITLALQPASRGTPLRRCLNRPSVSTKKANPAVTVRYAPSKKICP